jgi:LPS sulfotransferase NodH
LPNLHFVHLERRDLLGQAISEVRSRQSGAFRSTATPSREPRYDRRAIAAAMRHLVRQRARWDLYFARNGIEPLQLEYEKLWTDPQREIDRFSAWFGAREPAVVDPSKLTLRIQRDALSEAWRSRFLAEQRDLSQLDPAPGPPMADLLGLRRL